MPARTLLHIFFFFNDTATTEIYTLSLHDALPICPFVLWSRGPSLRSLLFPRPPPDRKSTRLNSSHSQISYAVFCLKKKSPLWKDRACVPSRSEGSAMRAHHIFPTCSRPPL